MKLMSYRAKIFSSCIILQFQILFFLSTGFLNAENNNNIITLLEYFKKNTPLQPNQKTTIIKDNITNVLILSPSGVTGGPEALCQLCHELSNAGFNVHILWASPDFSQIQKQFKNNAWYLAGQDHNMAPFAYQAKYNLPYLDHDLILDDSTLVIIPEVFGDFIPFFEEAKIAFYWLSITHLSSFFSNKYRTSIMQNKCDILHCVHFSDAPWITQEIAKLGITSELLEAPIASTYLNNYENSAKAANIIVYNPVKGADLSKSFRALYPDYDYFPLQNLNEEGIVNALKSAKIYIDFGDFPGKDRIPREALMCNCIIFIHNAGCATDFESFPIDNFFRFSNDDIENGVLNAKVAYTLQHYEKMQDLQQYMKQTIYQSPQKFRSQIKTLFGNPKQ